MQQQLVANIGQGTAAELCYLARDVELGVNRALGARCVYCEELRGNGGRRVTFATCVAAFGFERGEKITVVTRHERCLAFELRQDWSNFQFHLTAIDIAFNLGELCTRQTRREAL